MPLTIKQYVFANNYEAPNEASKHYVHVSAQFLSDPYYLDDGDQLLGRIVDLKKDNFPVHDLIDREIILILKKSVVFDNLYIEKTEWDCLFRENGLVLPGYYIEIVLSEIVRTKSKKKEKLYSNANVVA